MPSLRANRRGIIALLLATAAFTVNDTLTKIVVQDHPVGEVMFLRGLMTFFFISIVLVAQRETLHLRSTVNRLVLLRSLLDAAASAMFVTALVRMGIAELSAIVLASPLLLTMLAVIIFKEPVGWRRWSAVIVGMIGTLFIVKPDVTVVDVWAILGLVVALGVAARDLTTLRIDPAIPTTVISIFSAIALTVAGVLMGTTEEWQIFAAATFLIIAIAAFFYSIGTYFLVVAFRSVDVSVVSPFRYCMLIWAGLAGYLAFGDLPDGWSIFGTVLIVASGLYTLHRETVRHRYLSAKATPEI